MSLALIQESAKEVRRLAIAGSPLAVGDFRLKKLAAPLEQAGAKVPVFAQVAKAINDLVNGTEADSATNLLNLGTLLNAILYTQGQSSTDGAYRELEMVESRCTSTRTSARMLKPLVQALTSTGSGRIEIVKSAVERGVFNDLRLIDPAIQALGDIYPELADLVAEKILPGFGSGIAPRLKAGLNLKGKKQDARRLEIIHQLDPVGSVALCKSALEDGSPEVKTAAIACLGKHEDCVPLLIEQAKAKNKIVRAATLEALAEYDLPEVTKLFTELVTGTTLDILARPFRVMKSRQVLNSLLDEGRRVFDLMAKGDSEQIPRYCEVLYCLNARKESEVEEFGLTCFSQGNKVVKLAPAKNSYVFGDEIVSRLARLLYRVGTQKALEAILAKRETLSPTVFGYVLRSALRSWPAEKVFTEFSPLLNQTKGTGEHKRSELARFIRAGSWDPTSLVSPHDTVEDSDKNDEMALKQVSWDPRWLDAAIKSDQRTIACCFARPNHETVIAYLLDAGDLMNALDTGLLIQALVRCEYPKVTGYFLDLVTKKTKKAKNFDYELQLLFEGARHLPPTDLPQLDAFAETLDEKFVDKYLEALGPLRSINQKN